MKNHLSINKPSGFVKNIAKFFLLASLVVGIKNYYQKEVNQEHASMDFARNIDQLHTRDLLNYLVVTGEFDNKYYRKIHEKSGINVDIFDNLNQTKNIFLHAKNYQTIDEKKKAIEKIRSDAGMPILIHTDFEGGYVHNISILSNEDIESFAIPKEILAYRNQQQKEQGGLSALPSAEYLGKKYKNIALSGDHQARLDFIRMMEQYGKSIRKIMQYMDVDVVYGPNADIVDDFDAGGAKNYIASEGRSHGDNFIVAQDIISAFINGFQSQHCNILLVPKHFAGVGKSKNPHQETDTSDMHKDDGSVAIFKNIINGRNPFLDKGHISHCYALAAQREPESDYTLYLKNNLAFIDRLEKKNISLSGGDQVYGVMTTHISGNTKILGSNETITYSGRILENLKTKIGVHNPLSQGFIVSDDLGMHGAHSGLEQLNIEPTPENKIIKALAAGHDMTLYLETSIINKDIDAVLDVVAKMIDNGVDLNKDGKPDVTRHDLMIKAEKVMNLMAKQGRLQNIGQGKYQLNDATSYDINIRKILRDSRLSNQGALSGSSLDDYKEERNGKKDFISKKIKLLYETAAHNFPNALFKYLTMDESYAEALTAGKKLIVVDKSEHQLYIFTVDGSKLLESHTVGVGKGTPRLDYTHDRKILSDNKTPVGNYMVVNKIIGKEQYNHFSRDDIDNKGYYGGPQGGLLTLIGPRTPYIAIHGSSEKKTGPLSNACVRVVASDELQGKSDIKEQTLINHLAKTIPVGSYVIITN